MPVSSIQPIDRALSGATTLGRVDLGAMAMKGYSRFPKLQHCWNLTIRLFSVISRTLVRAGLTPLQRSSQCILQPQLTG